METLGFFVAGPRGEKKVPEWTEMESANAQCPKCQKLMVVIVGHGGLLYAFCPKCQRYFRGD